MTTWLGQNGRMGAEDVQLGRDSSLKVSEIDLRAGASHIFHCYLSDDIVDTSPLPAIVSPDALWS